jgi:WD40 repeat protein
MMGSPLLGHEEPVHILAFSPDGRMLASGGVGGRDVEGTPDKGEVRLWDVTTQTQIGGPLTGHTSAIYSLTFTPDGKTMASGSGGPIYFKSRADYSIILWDLSARSRRQEFFGHKSGVRSLAFTPDGEVLASGSADSSILLWNVPAGKEIEISEFLAPSLNSHRGAVVQMAFGSDDKVLTLSSTDTNNNLHAREIVFAEKQGQKTLFGIVSSSKFEAAYGKVEHVAFSPDGMRWAAGGCKRVHSNGLCVQGDVTVWNKRPASIISRPLPETGYDIKSVAISGDGKLIATGGCTKASPADCKGGEIRLWDAITLSPLGAPLKGLHHDVNAIAFSPDSKVIAAGSCGKFKVQGSFIACQEGEVQFWNVETRQIVEHLPASHLRQVKQLAFSADGKWMASNDGDRIIVWDATVPRAAGELANRGDYSIHSIAFSPDSTKLAAGTCHKSAERSGAYEWSKSGCVEGAIRLWDVRTRQAVEQPLLGHADVVQSVAYSPDGNTLVSAAGNFDGTIILWDAKSGQKLGRPFVGHVTGIEKVLFSPDGKLLASASDGSDAHHYDIMLWDVESRQAVGQPLSGHSSYISDIAFHPGSRILLSGGVDGKALLWNIDLDEWLAAACLIANRDLDADEWAQFLSSENKQKMCRVGEPIAE